jgi:hypothetical protein
VNATTSSSKIWIVGPVPRRPSTTAILRKLRNTLGEREAFERNDVPISFKREQLTKVRAVLGQQAVGIAQIARETGLTRQTIYRIKDDAAGAEAALGVWGCEYAPTATASATGHSFTAIVVPR